MNILEAVRDAADLLLKTGVPDAAHDALELMLFLKGWDLTRYLSETTGTFSGENLALSAEEEARYSEMAAQRAARIPLQHITGKAWFYGYEFTVNPSVLIPRPDTEILVHTVLLERREADRVLDLCTGSGCIAAVLKLEGRYGEVSASDIDPEALETARRNADALVAEIRFLEGDLFDALPDETERFDLIVSNPPYIAERDAAALEPEVRLHDPEKALFAGEDGLSFYRRIAEEAGQHLLPGGGLYLEIGWDEADAVTGLLSDHGFEELRVYRDLAGKDRVVRGIWKNV